MPHPRKRHIPLRCPGKKLEEKEEQEEEEEKKVEEKKKEEEEYASPQKSNLRLPGPPSGQGAGGEARTRERRILADIRADSLAIVPPTTPII
ncbi:hypothetical protein PoB_006085200 [Plakobranchus ocellatus]|uniref:Uncharacterized protein n=1 Tax=Plakobranchus ocellatus TaxID=259542 RepID=A0AAV4CR48_9GAST|nr:hypothetical protein PoB_006085200 [Plakobranchus ocellatus]